MNTFKTPKGTELPFIQLQGKDYLQVMHRLVWFREDHPDWSIVTVVVRSDNTHSVVRAEITHNSLLIASAHKREDAAHFKDHLEKAETGAIGRALALCGYGTQFAPELDEHERIVDAPAPRKVSPVPSPQPAKPHQSAVTASPGLRTTQGAISPSTGNKLATEAQIKRLYAIAATQGVALDVIHTHIAGKYSLTSAKDLDWKQYNEVVEWVQTEVPCGADVEQPGEFGAF